MTSSEEVSTMVIADFVKNESQEGITAQVDSWIAFEELPTRAGLKVLRKNDPNDGLTDDEIQERNEFIQWYLMQGFQVLLLIPTQTPNQDFFIPDCTVSDDAYSAFNTVDFQRMNRPFNKYEYAVRKILERVKDMAILYSCSSSPEDKAKVEQRYLLLVDLEFRERLLETCKRCRETQDVQRKMALKRRIGELNGRIMDCKRIWERYAPDDRWDD